MKTYPYMNGDRLIMLVEKRELDETRAELTETQRQTSKLLDRLDVVNAENADRLALIKRLHLAITARMSADDPTDKERLELHRAWQEAGAVLDQPAALSVRPNAAECGQCADKALPVSATETA